MLLSHPLFTEHRGKADFWCALENSVEVRGVLPVSLLDGIENNR
jgi:hypothetical protein